LGLGEDERLRLRNEAIAGLSRTDLRLDCSWPANPAGTDATVIGFDADSRNYACLDNGDLVVRRLPDNAVVARLPGHGPFERILPGGFSPIGRWMAAQFRRGERQLVQIWDVPAARALLANPLPVSPLGWWRSTVDFSPDNRTLALVESEDTITLHEL